MFTKRRFFFLLHSVFQAFNEFRGGLGVFAVSAPILHAAATAYSLKSIFAVTVPWLDVANDGEVLSLDQVEVVAIHRALVRTGGRVNEAASLLGLSRSALYRRLQHHGIKTR